MTAMTEIRRLGGEGILTENDLAELSAGCRRVLALMRDGQWHDAQSIRSAAGTNGTPASEGLRRLRELRQHFTVERERCGPGRDFRYRLLTQTPPDDKQQRELW